jgi:hypothetical protein
MELPASSIDRRTFLAATAGAVASIASISSNGGRARAADEAQPLDIGSRRELFIDDALIDRLAGNAALRLHHPVPQQIVLEHDAPWEGSGSGYHSVFQDAALYRMYYKAWHIDVTASGVKFDAHPLYCCYAESDNGITWRKPELGLVEFRGSKANNIVIGSGPLGTLQVDAGHPAIFKDENPAAPAVSRYKAIVRSSSKTAPGILAFQSPDGIHWSPMADKPILVDGAFDSQNLAFWDRTLGKYRAYWRIFTSAGGKRIRAIRTATSSDFIHWDKHIDLTYVDSPPEQLYTNQIKPYHRAPHILIGFPTRYVERAGESLKDLPEPDNRALRSAAQPRYGSAITEGLLMASRDGVRFKRWNEAFLRPGPERPGTWHYGHQYLGWHVVETQSDAGLPELSLYASESYWTGPSAALRRYTLRLDGFVSANSPLSRGELITRPFTFSGRELRLNFATSAAGSVRVEIQDPSGQPLPGYSAEDCGEIFGDALDRPVRWKSSADVSSLAGKPVRLRLALSDADLYSFRFVEA